MYIALHASPAARDSGFVALEIWCLTLTQTIRLIRNGERRGGRWGRDMNSSSARSDPPEVRSCVKVEVDVLGSRS